MKRAIIDRIVHRTTTVRQCAKENAVKDDQYWRMWAMDINHWDWVPGVGMYGLFKAWEYTRDEKINNFINRWIEIHISEANKIRTINSTAPLLTVLEMYNATKQKQYLDLCVDTAEWILKDAPRTFEGGLEHTVTEVGAGFSQQMWADTLFMACIFLAKLGKILENKSYLSEAALQLLIHHKYLKDHATGLFYHGWDGKEKNWMSGALWGRANAWMIISTVEILENLPEDFEGRTEITRSLLEQVEALKKFQRADGMFGTLLDDKDAYGETSATAGIAYALKKGIKNGYISASYAQLWQRAEKAVLANINDEGEVQGVSTGTPVMPTLDAYKKIDKYPTLYGQGLTLLMLSEE